MVLVLFSLFLLFLSVLSVAVVVNDETVIDEHSIKNSDQATRNFFVRQLHLLRRAWGEVKSETIKNCFRHAKFIHKEQSNEAGEGISEFLDGGKGEGELDEAMDGLLDAWTDMQKLGAIDAVATMQDFINVDDLVVTCGALMLAEIVAGISATEEEETEVSDSELMVVEQQLISRIDAQRAFAIARQYVEQNGDVAVLRHSDAIDDFFCQERKKKQKQPKISHFFQSNLDVC